MKGLKDSLREIGRYPSAIFGTIIILLLIAFSIYTMIKIPPYKEAIYLWRGGEAVVYKNPRTAPPLWYNWFTKEELPVSWDVNSTDDTEDIIKTVTPPRENGDTIDFSYSFDYEYDTFPQEMFIYIKSKYESKTPPLWWSH